MQQERREDRFREWQERRREAADADARIALESRLVKLEEGLANYNRRLDWIERVVWGAIVGMLAVFGKEVCSVYVMAKHRREDRKTGPE
jgi:hypothetical protein